MLVLLARMVGWATPPFISSFPTIDGRGTVGVSVWLAGMVDSDIC